MFYVAGYDPPFRITGTRHGLHTSCKLSRAMQGYALHLLAQL